jgi:hypothetical protein
MESIKFLTKANKTALVGISSYHSEVDYNPFVAEIHWTIFIDVKPYGIVGAYATVETVKASLEVITFLADDDAEATTHVEEMVINSNDGWRIMCNIDVSDLKNIVVDWVTFDLQSKTIIVE